MPIPPHRYPNFGTRRSKSAPAPSTRRSYDIAHEHQIVTSSKKWPVQTDDGKLSMTAIASINNPNSVRPYTHLPDDPDNTALLCWDKLSKIERQYALEKILYLLNSNDIGVFRLAPITYDSDGVVVLGTLCNLLAEAKTIVSKGASENRMYHIINNCCHTSVIVGASFYDTFYTPT